MDRRAFIQTTASVTLAAAAAGAEATRRRTVMPNNFQHVTGLINDWRRKDIKGVLARVTDDIAWHTHVGSPTVNGKPAMEQVLNTLATQMNDVKWRIFHHAEDGDRLFVEGVDEYTTTGGVDVAAPYAGVIEFTGDKISGWRDYVDRGVIETMKAGGGYSEQVRELIGRAPAA